MNQPKTAEPNTSTTRRAIIADDDSDLRRLLSGVLRREGFEVLEAKDGFELVQLVAEAIVEKSLPDVIVTDVWMPGCTGLDALASLRGLNVTVPVIIITAFADIELADKGRVLGDERIVRKPFTTQEFRRHILSAIDRGPVAEPD